LTTSNLPQRHRGTEKERRSTQSTLRTACDSTRSACGAGRAAGREPADTNHPPSFIGFVSVGSWPEAAASRRRVESPLCLCDSVANFFFVRLRDLRVFVVNRSPSYFTSL